MPIRHLEGPVPFLGGPECSRAKAQGHSGLEGRRKANQWPMRLHVNALRFPCVGAHSCPHAFLSLTLTLIQGAAVVVGLACWLMLLPMLPGLWVKDAGLGLGLERRSEESYVICVRLGGRHERKLSTREC